MRLQQKLVGAFDIAGVVCQLACRDDAFWSLLASRYADFASDVPPRFSLSVEMVEPPADEVTARWRGPYARIGGRDGGLTIDGPGFRGAFDERSRRGWIAQPFDPAPLETFLTAIYASELLRNGGFLLHAAALAAPEGVRVFFGPSGSGKTTVSELIGERVISDETTAIRRVEDGWRVSGVPWRGSRLEGNLAGLFHLRKARATSFVRLTSVLAVRELLGCVLFSRADGAEVTRFLEIVGDLVQAVPCYDMHFTPDRSFWGACPTRERGGAAWCPTTTD
jgi:hypothetical protein